jgi:multiple sugar transport system permease protein
MRADAVKGECARGRRQHVTIGGVVRWVGHRALPLRGPALATLEFTWVHNDFLWALVFISNPGKLPVTSSLNNLRGQFFTDHNLPAAGSVPVALPTIPVFLLPQRHFVAGLTLGPTKG